MSLVMSLARLMTVYDRLVRWFSSRSRATKCLHHEQLHVNA